ncbi:outer membrane beta-barrel protein [Lewinella sp. IMCC34183]|uniref:outer membrane beta-barrel protein n=1 Tax=Lewinella sp. IMCC34183 TaxID=2248762 RepID=UPI000E25929C|nr:outer membrane beta-barrel protein [Lewinella sp. IMCC34183]
MRGAVPFALILAVSGIGAQSGSSVELSGELLSSFPTLDCNGGELDEYNFFLYREDQDIPDLNWNLSLAYNQRLGKSYVVRAGIQLASLGYRQKTRTDVYWNSEFATGVLIPNPGLPHEYTPRVNHHFLEIPIGLRREFGTGRWQPFVAADLLPGLYLITRYRTTGDEEIVIRREDNCPERFNAYSLSGQLSVGINYRLGEEWQLFGQPTFRYQIVPMQHETLKERLYAGGMRFGIRRMI